MGWSLGYRFRDGESADSAFERAAGPFTHPLT
ncbi:hypothetical protein J2S54_004821 [Streptomyces sp. DSM 42143]|nr:hypothetical protein [Streptomyces sp. DSM 42143]